MSNRPKTDDGRDDLENALTDIEAEFHGDDDEGDDPDNAA
jgi:hypothetical protein